MFYRYNMGIFVFIYMMPIVVMATLYTRVSMELNRRPQVGERVEKRQEMRLIERKKVKWGTRCSPRSP